VEDSRYSERRVWAIISPSARQSVTYLNSSLATSAANEVQRSDYLAIVLPSKPVRTLPRSYTAYLVQSASHPLSETYLPISPYRTGPRKPPVPDFEWPFGDCVINTGTILAFDPPFVDVGGVLICLLKM
jgi:hypothetical protein